MDTHDHPTSDEGTSYCPAAEAAGREVERLREGIREHRDGMGATYHTETDVRLWALLDEDDR